jgi:mannose-6-phosphate isomerase-like protein (cupin superfamily)
VAFADDVLGRRAASGATLGRWTTRSTSRRSWHEHDESDDFFLVLDGRLTIQLRDRDVVLGLGELFVVPRGVEHCRRQTRRRTCC